MHGWAEGPGAAVGEQLEARPSLCGAQGKLWPQPRCRGRSETAPAARGPHPPPLASVVPVYRLLAAVYFLTPGSFLACNQELPPAAALEKFQMFLGYSRVARERFEVRVLQVCLSKSRLSRQLFQFVVFVKV